MGAWTKYDPREYAYHYIDFLVPTDQLRDYMEQWFCKKAQGRLLEAGEDFRRYAVALKGFKRYDAKGGANCLTFFDLFLRGLHIGILSPIACRPVEETYVSKVIRLEQIAPYLNNQDAPLLPESGMPPEAAAESSRRGRRIIGRPAGKDGAAVPPWAGGRRR